MEMFLIYAGIALIVLAALGGIALIIAASRRGGP
jgi:hypothetical protein